MKPLHELTASEALRERFDLEADFASAPSPTGAQLACIENKLLGPGHNGARPDTGEDRRIRMMDLMNLSKHLSPQELQVCRLRYWTLAQSVPYEKNRRMSDIMEGDGETVIDPRPLCPEGKTMPGFVRVRGFKIKAASYEAVAARMAVMDERNDDGDLMTAGATEKRDRTAVESVGESLRWLKFKMLTEESET